MGINIEKLKSKDIAKYKNLVDECFNGSNEQLIYDNSYDENSKSYQILVAKDNDKIVGSLTFYKIDLFTFSFQPALEIFNVCVKKEYRNQKIAKKLFERTIKFAKKNNYKSINLTCLDTATNAHRLYESLGMERTNSIKYLLKL